MRFLRVTALALLLGCASSAVPDDDAAARTSRVVENTTSPAPAAAPVDDVTSTVTPLLDRDGHVVEISYPDVTGSTRSIQVELRLPEVRVDAAIPVVVWSHGGSQGFRNAGNVGVRWGRAMNDAGHAFVAIAHPGRTEAERRLLCEAVAAAECARFSPLRWDRPHDVTVVLDWVESIAAAHDLDVDSIVYAGHSAGASATLTVAGAGWTYDTELAPPSDPRPIGFLAASPPGAESHGLTAEALASIDRPMLVLTGLGDTTSSTTSAERRLTVDRLPDDIEAGLVWIDREEARHGLFDLNVAPCERAGGSERSCRQAARLLATIGTQYVTELSDDPDAFDAADLASSLSPRLPAAVTITV